MPAEWLPETGGGRQSPGDWQAAGRRRRRRGEGVSGEGLRPAVENRKCSMNWSMCNLGSCGSVACKH